MTASVSTGASLFPNTPSSYAAYVHSLICILVLVTNSAIVD